MTRPRRSGRLLLVALLLAVVNLPVAHGAWTDWRLDRDGVETVATVTEYGQVSGEGGLVEFTFDPDIDPDQREWTAGLDEDAYQRAEDSGTVEVTVDPGDPARYRVAGEQGSGLLVVLTAFADVVLVLAGVLMLRRRGLDDDGVLHLVALEDVARCRPGPALEQLDPQTYRVTGEVSHLDETGLVLDLGHRRVRVDLGDFANPVGWQQPARVTGRLRDSAP